MGAFVVKLFIHTLINSKMETIAKLKHYLIDLFVEIAWRLRDKSLDFKIGQEVKIEGKTAFVQNYFGWGMWEIKFANDERYHLDFEPSTYIYEHRDIKTI